MPDKTFINEEMLFREIVRTIAKEEFERRKNSLNHVVGRAHHEGRVLHGLS